MDTQVLYSIGEVAKLKNITVKTLRYYHEIGLLIPRYINEENGYRYYSIEQLIHLDMITTSRGMDVSIKELQDIHSHKDINYIIDFFDNKKREVKNKIESLKEVEARITNINNRLKEEQDIIKSDSFNIDYYEERYIITLPVTVTNEDELILDYLQLDNKLKEYGINTMYKTGTKCIFKGNSAEVKYVFEVIDEKDYNKYKEDSSISIIPSGYYLNFIFTIETEELRFKEMIKFAKAKKLDLKFIICMDLHVDIFNIGEFTILAQVYLGKNAPK